MARPCTSGPPYLYDTIPYFREVQSACSLGRLKSLGPWALPPVVLFFRFLRVTTRRPCTTFYNITAVAAATARRLLPDTTDKRPVAPLKPLSCYVGDPSGCWLARDFR